MTLSMDLGTAKSGMNYNCRTGKSVENENKRRKIENSLK